MTLPALIFALLYTLVLLAILWFTADTTSRPGYVHDVAFALAAGTIGTLAIQLVCRVWVLVSTPIPIPI